MALHLATLEGHQPDQRMSAYATAIHAALVEAGYPNAHVSASNAAVLVSGWHHDFETGQRSYGPPHAVVQRAFEVCAPLDPRVHSGQGDAS